MRKIYKHSMLLGLGLMLSLTNIKAQTADFENLTLAPESFWDGSDLSGTHNNGEFYSEFTSGDFTFPNVYDTTWGAPGYWSVGFTYSNMTDSITSGSGNKYSSKAGGGDSSSNYIVASNNSYIKNNNISNAIQLSINNSTYAYNSMRDGDAFAKKFGGATGDDPDWFKVTIKTYSNTVFQDSTVFYLADFRFSDNSQDYIVKDWNQISLPQASSQIDSLHFQLSSSDVGLYGMNTPAFFCLDNIENIITTNVYEIAQTNFSLYPNPTSNVLNIRNTEVIESIQVLDINGRVVKTNTNLNTQQHRLDVSDLQAGVYFIQLVADGAIQVQKFIKQ